MIALVLCEGLLVLMQSVRPFRLSLGLRRNLHLHRSIAKHPTPSLTWHNVCIAAKSTKVESYGDLNLVARSAVCQAAAVRKPAAMQLILRRLSPF